MFWQYCGIIRSQFKIYILPQMKFLNKCGLYFKLELKIQIFEEFIYLNIQKS